MEKVAVKKLRPGAVMPKFGSKEAAGADLYACLEKSVTIAPGQTVFIPTGLAMALPRGYVGLVYARSGLACKQDLAPANKVGVIDSDYRGEICVGLCNLGTQPYEIQPGERIAQLVVMPVCPLPVQETAELDQTQRGGGGFGGSGSRKRPAPPEARVPKRGRTKPSLRSETVKPVCLREKIEICLGRGAF